MQLLMRLSKLLEEKGGSDIHLLEGERPRLRIRGDLWPIDAKDHPLITRGDIEEILDTCLTPEQRATFDRTMDTDFSVELDGASGRVNAGLVNGRKLYLIMRYLPARIIPLDELGLDVPMLKAIADAEEGLIVVTGETSSGKTTTVAAILDYINSTRRRSITTIENPVEYMMPSKECLVTRREVGRDTPDFRTALRSSVRKNPDVLLIGEIRDAETAAIAMSAAETGIQTYCTFHALGVLAAIVRLADILVGEGHTEDELYLRLSATLRAIVSQQLVKHVGGKALLPIYEILNVTFTEREYLREKNLSRLEHSLESERNISRGLCLYRLWHQTPRPIDEETIRRIYGPQYSLAMNRLNDTSGYKPLVTDM
jgi:twitching motility protein PilT